MLWIANPSSTLAAGVTVDVLLKKSDVRGALGWIGAAWFSPIFGGLIYYLFGINRVTRRALKMGRRKDAQTRPSGSCFRTLEITIGLGIRVAGV